MIVERQKWFSRYRMSDEVKLQILCFPYAGGSESIYSKWIDHIKGDIEIIAICLPGRARRFTDPPHCSVVELVNELFPDVEAILKKPYVIFGHSMGSKIGYELLKKIVANNLTLPKKFIASACVAPSVNEQDKSLWKMPDQEFLEAVVSMNGIPEEVASNVKFMSFLTPMLKNDFKMSCSYFDQCSPKLEVEAHVVYGTFDRLPEDHVSQWCMHFCGRTYFYPIEGDHFYIENQRELFFKVINSILKTPNVES